MREFLKVFVQSQLQNDSHQYRVRKRLLWQHWREKSDAEMLRRL